MIVLLLKGKLFQTENVIPFMAALAKYTNKKFLIIYPTKSDYKIIKNNKDIFFALKKLGKVKYFYSTFDLDERFIYGKRKGVWYTFLGLFSVLYRNIILLPLLYKRAIIFGIEKLPFTEWILNFNKNILNGKRISFLLYPYDITMLKGEINKVLSTKKEFMPLKKLLYDANVLISSYSDKEIEKLSQKLQGNINYFM